MVREHVVDERIANLESNESLKDKNFPVIFICGDKNSIERYDRLADENRIAIENASRVMRSHEDLACLLRLIPVQMMKDSLPRLVEEYCNKGYNSLEKGSISINEPVMAWLFSKVIAHLYGTNLKL